MDLFLLSYFITCYDLMEITLLSKQLQGYDTIETMIRLYSTYWNLGWFVLVWKLESWIVSSWMHLRMATDVSLHFLCSIEMSISFVWRSIVSNFLAICLWFWTGIWEIKATWFLELLIRIFDTLYSNMTSLKEKLRKCVFMYVHFASDPLSSRLTRFLLSFNSRCMIHIFF